MKLQEDVLHQSRAFRMWTRVVVSFFSTAVLPLALLAIGYSRGSSFLLAGKTIAALIAFFAAVTLLSIGTVWLAIDGIAREHTGHRSGELRLLTRIGRRALRRASLFGLLYGVGEVLPRLLKWAASWFIVLLLLVLPDKKSESK
jgi:hypothetical protein